MRRFTNKQLLEQNRKLTERNAELLRFVLKYFIWVRCDKNDLMEEATKLLTRNHIKKP